MGAKWLEILKQIAPHVTRVGVLRYPTTPRGSGQIGAMQAATASFGVDDAATIERGVSAFAQQPNAGLVIFPQSRRVRSPRTNYDPFSTTTASGLHTM